ncbi:hypothetical protein [Ferirhizobium litorale]|uniref:Uncharacterized protein n=1 Tax=Ferirhizobium litorale TaxID=2927786 RepID=A0AAE3QIK5_9HYPH|nr:hypothetical protein [Fererhizobium litorale]MDI7924615.1 hypothetical protein [Fererhizobium litorale]
MAMKTGEPSWKWRRLVTIAVVVWSFWMLVGLIDAIDSELNQIIATGLLILIGGSVGGYMGFATAQDVAAIWRTGRALPYRDEGEREP